MNFNGKIVLVTGAASGIGEDVSINFAKLGAKVALVDVNEAGLQTVINKINANGSSAALIIVADVVRDAPEIIERTIQHFGQLDVLINNAGIARLDTVSSLDLNTFDQIFATNCRAVMQLTQLAISHLERTKGNIVNLSSISGFRPMPSLMSYGVSKAALNMFTRCASLELAPRGIRVNAVNPAVVRSPMLHTVGLDEEKVRQMAEAFEKEYPAGRLGEIPDVTNAVLFLASDTSSFITGTLLLVDGGRLNA